MRDVVGLAEIHTGETAFVQVKSSASQATLDDCVRRMDAGDGWSRLIFACHSPRGSIDVGDRPDVVV